MSLETEGKDKITTAQGKHGFWMFIFPDRKNTGNLHKNIKNLFVHGKFTSNLGEVFNFQKIKNVIGLW